MMLLSGTIRDTVALSPSHKTAVAVCGGFSSFTRSAASVILQLSSASMIQALQWKKQPTGDAGCTEASLSSRVYSMPSTSCAAARPVLCAYYAHYQSQLWCHNLARPFQLPISDNWQGASLRFNFYDFSVTVGALAYPSTASHWLLWWCFLPLSGSTQLWPRSLYRGLEQPCEQNMHVTRWCTSVAVCGGVTEIQDLRCGVRQCNASTQTI